MWCCSLLCKYKFHTNPKCCTICWSFKCSNLSQLESHIIFNSFVNLNRNSINNLLPRKLPIDAITEGQVQTLIGRIYDTLFLKRNNIAILHKCALGRLIYSLCRYINNTQEEATVSLLPLVSLNNDKDTTNREAFNDPIQLNDSPYTNPMPFTTDVYNQKPITYKHPYTLFVFQITPSYSSSRYANNKYS